MTLERRCTAAVLRRHRREALRPWQPPLRRSPANDGEERASMPVRLSQTFGPNAVDWENRVDMDRLRQERLARLNAELEKSELGALLSFDFANIRYMTATHIGTWAVDKLIRFAVLPRGGKPVVWDFGSAARHHQLYNPWLDHTDGPATPEGAARTGARAGISTLPGAFHPAAGIAAAVAPHVVGCHHQHRPP